MLYFDRRFSHFDDFHICGCVWMIKQRQRLCVSLLLLWYIKQPNLVARLKIHQRNLCVWKHIRDRKQITLKLTHRISICVILNILSDVSVCVYVCLMSFQHNSVFLMLFGSMCSKLWISDDKFTIYNWFESHNNGISPCVSSSFVDTLRIFFSLSVLFFSASSSTHTHTQA